MSKIYEQTNLIAHRGLSGLYFENSLPAFISACKSPFFGIETDIQFTADNKIICFHDKSAKRLLGKKEKISNLKLRDLKKMPFVSKVPQNTTNVCTFDRYLKTCKKYKKHCVIEIKYRVTAEQLNRIINKIKWYRYMNKCIIISFNPSIIKYLREKEPSIKLQLLIKNPIRRYYTFCKNYNIDVSLMDKLVSTDTVQKLKQAGFKVAVWTVNNERYAQKLVNMGVDYITSDQIL